MFTLALLVGIYAYIIFLEGLVGVLFKPVLVATTLFFLGGATYYFRQSIHDSLRLFGAWVKKQRGLSSVLLGVLILQAIVNSVGALGPELSFDALWYHLTLPKIYLLTHAVVHIPGGLLYYSDMPKLIELLYAGMLGFGVDSLPKVAHLIFGILTLFALYKVARYWYPAWLSLLALVIFYANLVVGWESISGLVDLGRTFFEVMALWGLLRYAKEKEKKWLYISAVMLGFALTSKILAVWSIVAMLPMIIGIGRLHGEKFVVILRRACSYIFLVLLIPFPWFIFSFIHTGNPIYPLFNPLFQGATKGMSILQLINPVYVVQSFWQLFTHADDPLSPWYLLVLPLIIAWYKKTSITLRLLYFYSAIALLCWYVTPHIGGGRFILPYLPVFSIISVFPIAVLEKTKQYYLLIAVAIFIAVTSIFYRGIANAKYLPVVLGQESKKSFLTKNLNFSFGDFYDTDGYFASHIKSTDMVLLYGFHNLYYVDFPFVDSSWVQKGTPFNYIAVQNGQLPLRFRTWTRIYANPMTRVTLYTAGRIPWTY